MKERFFKPQALYRGIVRGTVYATEHQGEDSLMQPGVRVVREGDKDFPHYKERFAMPTITKGTTRELHVPMDVSALAAFWRALDDLKAEDMLKGLYIEGRVISPEDYDRFKLDPAFRHFFSRMHTHNKITPWAPFTKMSPSLLSKRHGFTTAFFDLASIYTLAEKGILYRPMGIEPLIFGCTHFELASDSPEKVAGGKEAISRRIIEKL